MKKVKDLEINSNTSLRELVESFGLAGGFTAKKVYDAAKMLEMMENEKEITRILSFPADIISTGSRGLIRKMVEEKKFDIIITTCGTLDHDIARAFSSYYHGDFEMDDIDLAKRGIYRLGNVIIPKENYGKIIEEKMNEFFKSIEKKEWSTYELVWELGRFINKKDSILYWAYVNKIPIIVPGITDGAVGSQLWSHWEIERNFKINIFLDEHLLSDIIFTAKKTGALMIGGGISKHHTIWWNQFRGGLDYAIYITTAVEWDGSLSGARTREAISWGKIKPRARHITVEGDATVLLPLVASFIL
ncbi:MAG: deoxyhypusine synthase [Thermoplasmata archaeon]|nr:deoxyhypusine synthase [Euryarchaeota archaeon]MVT35705.1 deoxyhypusine synthase [Euryarchaeota archaeon]